MNRMQIYILIAIMTCTSSHHLREHASDDLHKIPPLQKKCHSFGDSHSNSGIFAFSNKWNVRTMSSQKNKMCLFEKEKHKQYCIQFPILVGHRGLGEEACIKKTNYVENTVKSFLEAKDRGASFVEFDVQLTEDNIPIIYHNFHIKDELISKTKSSEFLQRTPENLYLNDQISNNNDSSYIINHKDLYLNCTLEEAFIFCENLGFNIEIKYPSIEEQEANKMYEIMNVESYLQPILNVVNKFDKKSLYFSSFSLEVCKHLMCVQSKYDVFYLTDEYFYEALQHAIRYNFTGIVMDTNKFDLAYIRKAHDADKKIILYGKATNIYEFTKIFIQEGGDGVITDNIDDVKQAFE